MKRCNKCERVLPVEEFYKKKEALDGYNNACKDCFRARSRAWYEENREHVIARVRQWGADNPDRIRERYTTDRYRQSQRSYRAKNRDRINEQQRTLRAADPERYRRYDLSRRLRKFGVTLDQYDALIEAQGGVCAICEGPPNGKDDVFHVDHDHQTGMLRGLLCHSCNTSLGHFRDDVVVLQRAIEYLAEPPFRRIAA